jgi:hypothetical protein
MMKTWKCNKLGKDGRLFILMHISFVIVFCASIIFLTWFAMLDGKLADQILIAVCFTYSSSCVITSIKGIRIVGSTIKQITYDGDLFYCQTFNNSCLAMNESLKIKKDPKLLGKGYLGTIFRDSNGAVCDNNFIIEYDSKDYYLSCNMTNMDDLLLNLGKHHPNF